MLKHLFLPTRQTIVVGGGFAVHAMGYTTQFGDIDIFLPDDVLDIFVSNVEQLNPLFHLQRLERWVYSPPFHTYPHTSGLLMIPLILKMCIMSGSDAIKQLFR